MTRIAVLAAQHDEVAPLLARLGARRDGADRDLPRWRAVLGGTELEIAVGGMGRRRARAAAGRLLAAEPPRHLFVVGVAGALEAGLEIGELVVGAAVATEHGQVLRAEPGDLEPAIQLGARPAAIVTVDRMVTRPADRRAIVELVGPELDGWRAGGLRAGAISGAAVPAPEARAALPLVVDMESYDAIEAAAARGVPATVLRAVSDTPADVLPAFLERCRRADGDLDRGRAALGALLRPATLPTLLELRRRMRLCAGRLVDPILRLAGR